MEWAISMNFWSSKGQVQQAPEDVPFEYYWPSVLQGAPGSRSRQLGEGAADRHLDDDGHPSVEVLSERSDGMAQSTFQPSNAPSPTLCQDL